MSRKRTEITSPDRETVAALLHSTSDPRDQERLIVARMAMTGQHTLAMMAEAVGRARSCIQTWLNSFEAGGVDALLRRTPPPGRPPSLSPEVQEQLHAHLSAGTWRTAREMRGWLKETHQIEITLKGCYYWLGKSRGVLKAPRPCHHHQAPGAVLDFKMQHWQERLASLSLPAGAPVRFWVMDESRFGLHTVVRHCWGLRGKRVIKPFQQRFDWEYLYGAVDILSGEPVFCHMPTVSCEAVWTFLGELVQTDPGAHHVILWDGAGFHQPPPAGEEEWAALAKVHVLKLPPYCPELNPTEKIQDQLKDAVCNRVFGTIEALQEGMLPKLREFWENPLGLSSLIGNNWLRHQVNASYRVILPAFK